jgi:hypothetical protein
MSQFFHFFRPRATAQTVPIREVFAPVTISTLPKTGGAEDAEFCAFQFQARR